MLNTIEHTSPSLIKYCTYKSQSQGFKPQRNGRYITKLFSMLTYTNSQINSISFLLHHCLFYKIYKHLLYYFN